MRLTCLVDNSVQPQTRYWGEHGLAYLIETGESRVLLDTGQSGTVLMHNLQALGVDPFTIDAIAISHAHSDHTGGLRTLLDHTRPGIHLYANPDLFRERYEQRSGRPRDIGISWTREALAARVSIRLVSEPTEIASGVWTTGEITDRSEPQGGSTHHAMQREGVLVPDEYLDDMAVVLKESGRVTLLCGCCHAGLLNTLTHVERKLAHPIVTVLGGLHLIALSDDEVRRCANRMAAMPVLERVYPGHCTGMNAFTILHAILGASKVRFGSVGTIVEV